MKTTLVRFVVPLVLALGALGARADRAAAQLRVGVHLSWHWSDDGWRSGYAQPRGDVYYTPAPRTRNRIPVRAIRIPPGHLPPPGLCRLWYVGRPPGHQPPATSCARLFRSYRHPGVLILQGAPRFRDDDAWYRYDPRWDRESRYYRDGRDGRYYRDDPGRWDDGRSDRYEDRAGPPGRRGKGKGKPGRGRGGG